jgi:hypothetical protein
MESSVPWAWAVDLACEELACASTTKIASMSASAAEEAAAPILIIHMALITAIRLPTIWSQVGIGIHAA